MKTLENRKLFFIHGIPEFPAQENIFSAQEIPIPCAGNFFSCAGNSDSLRRKFFFLRRKFQLPAQEFFFSAQENISSICKKEIT
jgi:hypothetical protein